MRTADSAPIAAGTRKESERIKNKRDNLQSTEESAHLNEPRQTK